MAKEISNLITFNTYKFERGGLLVDMFNQFNARVGDQGTELAIQWETSKTETKINLKERGLHFFGTGSVGQYLEKLEDGTGFKMSADASTVEWEDKDEAGSLDDGITVVKLPKQFFPQKGIFFGYFGLKDRQGNIFTSVNVWFRVLGGVPTMGAAIPYFVTEFDEVLERCNGKIVDALAELREKYQAEVKKNEDMSAETRATLSKLADAVGVIQAQIDAGNVVTKKDFQDGLDKVANDAQEKTNKAISNLTSGSPHPIANYDELLKQYPKGTEGLWVTKDKGIRYVYIDNSWQNFGPYEAVTIDNKEINYNNLNFGMIATKRNYNNLLDPQSAIYGYYYYANASNVLSEIPNQEVAYVKIAVQENEKIYISGTTQALVFTDDKNQLVQKFPAVQYFGEKTADINVGTVPFGASWMYVTFRIDEIANGYIGRSDYKQNSVVINDDAINDNSINSRKLDTLYMEDANVNHYDKTKVQIGYYVDYLSGNIGQADGFALTDYIAVDPRLHWAVVADVGELDQQIAFYDTNKAYISGVATDKDLAKVDLPQTARYMRVTIHSSQIDNFRIYPVNKISMETIHNSQDIYVGANQKFTTIKDGLLYALAHRYTVVHVLAGIYDIAKELGDDYFKNYTKEFTDAYSETARGLPLGNNVRVIFDSRAKVVFNYTGNNQWVNQYFSLFSCYPKGTGATVENLHAEASNCHYIIHDDLGAYDAGSLITTSFKHCNLKLDNTQNPVEHKSTIIGGGLTYDQHVEINDCNFNGANGYTTISYHNHVLGNSRSTLVLKDNYFAEGNGFQAISTGTNPDHSLFLLSGNSFGHEITQDKLNASDEINVDVKAWNNEVRN